MSFYHGGGVTSPPFSPQSEGRGATPLTAPPPTQEVPDRNQWWTCLFCNLEFQFALHVASWPSLKSCSWNSHFPHLTEHYGVLFGWQHQVVCNLLLYLHPTMCMSLIKVELSFSLSLSFLIVCYLFLHQKIKKDKIKLYFESVVTTKQET